MPGNPLSANHVERFTRRVLSVSLSTQVLTAMALGIAVGVLFPTFATQLKFLGDIFLRLIKTAVAPLVFICVTLGIVAAGDFKRVSRIGLIAMIYFEIVSTIALGFGAAFGNLTNVGRGLSDVLTKSARSLPSPDHLQGGTELIWNIFPDSFVGAFTKSELLQVIVISVILGTALLGTGRNVRDQVEQGMKIASDALFAFIHIIMHLAPLGAFGAIAFAVGSNGSAVLLSLLYLVLMFYAAVAAFIIVGLGTVCAIFQINLFILLRFLRRELSIVLGTASSESVLPSLMERLPNFGCSRRCVSLALPAGFAFNLDGTSIYMSMAMIFLANAYNVHLDLWQQLGILAVMLATSKGVATVSGGSFVVFSATIAGTGIFPLEGLPMLFGVYRIMSIGIALTNVIGNSVATVVVAKLSGEFGSAPEEVPVSTDLSPNPLEMVANVPAQADRSL
jgi:aerobic C4-dicarboxylate transport protein